MKKLILLVALVAANFSYSQKQVSMHMYIHVAPENQSQFEHLEIDYWSKVAQNEIKKGNMTGWGLMKNVGIDSNASEANYLQKFEYRLVFLVSINPATKCS